MPRYCQGCYDKQLGPHNTSGLCRDCNTLSQKVVDPTPEEIAERARLIREENSERDARQYSRDGKLGQFQKYTRTYRARTSRYRRFDCDY